MKTLLLAISLLLCFESATFGQANIKGLPKGAVVVETRKLLSPGHANRMLLLWMLNPKRNPTGYAPDDISTCPDQTRGSHYSAPTRVSLVNSATMTIMNTINIGTDEDSTCDFDFPYSIPNANYYHVEAPLPTRRDA